MIVFYVTWLFRNLIGEKRENTRIPTIFVPLVEKLFLYTCVESLFGRKMSNEFVQLIPYIHVDQNNRILTLSAPFCRDHTIHEFLFVRKWRQFKKLTTENFLLFFAGILTKKKTTLLKKRISKKDYTEEGFFPKVERTFSPITWL